MKGRRFRGKAAKFNTFSDAILGEHLTVGASGEYADIDAALVYAKAHTWESTPAMSGTASTTQGSELVVGVGTSFLSETSANNFITIDGNIQAVRDVQDDTHLRLWHGAMTTISGSEITAKNQSYFTIEFLENSEVGAAHTMPDGVGLKIVARTENLALIINSYSILSSTYNYIEITHCRILLDGVMPVLNNAPFGAGGASRSTFNIHGITYRNNGDGSEISFMLYGASITLDNVGGDNIRCLLQSDYLYANLFTVNKTIEDVILFDTFNTYDIAYEHELVGLGANKESANVDSTGSMFEINVSVAGKVSNVRDSNIYFIPLAEVTAINNETTIPMYGAAAEAGHTLNIIDSIIHTEDFPGSTKDWYEIYKRAGTINIVGTTSRADGSSVRVLVA